MSETTYIGEATRYIDRLEAQVERLEAIRDLPSYDKMSPKQRRILKGLVHRDLERFIEGLMK